MRFIFYLKGYLGSVLRKLSSVIQNGALKKKVSTGNCVEESTFVWLGLEGG